MRTNLTETKTLRNGSNFRYSCESTSIEKRKIMKNVVEDFNVDEPTIFDGAAASLLVQETRTNYLVIVDYQSPSKRTEKTSWLFPQTKMLSICMRENVHHYRRPFVRIH